MIRRWFPCGSRVRRDWGPDRPNGGYQTPGPVTLASHGAVLLVFHPAPWKATVLKGPYADSFRCPPCVVRTLDSVRSCLRPEKRRVAARSNRARVAGGRPALRRAIGRRRLEPSRVTVCGIAPSRRSHGD